MKFIFDKPFKFSRFPTILKCHERYNQLVDESYDMEAKYEAGQCSGEEWGKAIYISKEYSSGEYAQTVFQEFYGHGLYIQDWRSKKVMKFDDYFKAPFADINSSDRKLLVSLVERKYGFKLTADFYE